jgi:hypothetical protein
MLTYIQNNDQTISINIKSFEHNLDKITLKIINKIRNNMEKSKNIPLVRITKEQNDEMRRLM